MIVGDPTEGALLVAARKAGLEWETVSHQFPRLDVIPFESQRQYMVTLHRRTDDSSKVVYLKGAIEKVLSLCSHELDPGGKERPCDPDMIYREAHNLAERGLRLLGFARGRVSPETNQLDPDQLPSGLTWLGLQGMMDPPRSEAIRAVQACQAAGLTIKMITGDHAVTARVIAQKIGLTGASLPRGEVPRVMMGSDLAVYPVNELPRGC